MIITRLRRRPTFRYQRSNRLRRPSTMVITLYAGRSSTAITYYNSKRIRERVCAVSNQTRPSSMPKVGKSSGSKSSSIVDSKSSRQHARDAKGSTEYKAMQNRNTTGCEAELEAHRYHWFASRREVLERNPGIKAWGGRCLERITTVGDQSRYGCAAVCRGRRTEHPTALGQLGSVRVRCSLYWPFIIGVKRTVREHPMMKGQFELLPELVWSKRWRN